MFPLSTNKEYGPGEVCSWLNLSRTTLSRWESKGRIPTVNRGKRSSRLYSSEDVIAIIGLVREGIGDEIRDRSRDGLPIVDQSLAELLYRTKILLNPDAGLDQMRSVAKGFSLSPKTSSLLIGAALELPIGHRYRSAVWEIMVTSDLTAQRLKPSTSAQPNQIA